MSYNKTTGMYVGYIYRVTNMITNEMYIGQTRTNMLHRKGQHLKESKCDNPKLLFHKMIKQYGISNFSWNCVETIVCATREELINELNSKEIYYIKLYNSLIPNGYNISEGGGIRNFNLTAVDVYDINGVFVETCDSVTQCSKKYNIPDKVICSICLGRYYKSSKTKYIFRYTGEPFDLYDINTTTRQYKIYQYNYKTGELIKVYNNLTELVKLFHIENVSSSSIYNKILYILHNENKYGMAYGYYWSLCDTFDFNIFGKDSLHPVDKYSVDGKYIDTYLSMLDGARSENSEHAACIADMCNGLTYNPILGHVWRYHQDPYDLYPVNVNYRGTRVSVDQYSLNGEFIATFDTIRNACIANNIDIAYATSISACCLDKKQYALGYVWRYHGEPYRKPRLRKNMKPVNVYTLDDVFINTYNCASQGAKDLLSDRYHNKMKDCIRACLDGKRPTMYGYKWFYVDDPNQPDKSKIII